MYKRQVLVSGENKEQNTIADCANAVENMAIAAKALGLDSCYLASYQVCLNAPSGGEYKKMLGIPEGYVPNFALAIGYGAEQPCLLYTSRTGCRAPARAGRWPSR